MFGGTKASQFASEGLRLPACKRGGIIALGPAAPFRGGRGGVTQCRFPSLPKSRLVGRSDRNLVNVWRDANMYNTA